MRMNPAGRPFALTEEEIESIIEAYEQGFPVSDIAEAAEVGQDTIYRLIKIHDLKRVEYSPHFLSSLEKDKIERLLNKGKSTKEIAEMMQLGRSTISKIKRELGFERDKPGKKPGKKRGLVIKSLAHEYEIPPEIIEEIVFKFIKKMKD